MSSEEIWSRRRFLGSSGATLAGLTTGMLGGAGALEAQTARERELAREAAHAMPAPGVITGGIRPLLYGTTARPLRYRPEGDDFVIRNGAEFFNRPLYGPNNPFRVDAGDKPEFSFYLPGHGGNLKLGLIAAGSRGSKWAAEADEVVTRYRPGRMIYEIRDGLLGAGTVRVELVTAGQGSGLLMKVEGHALPSGTALAWGFGGLSGRKGRRNGDIGCEVEPVAQFFQVREEECAGNEYTVEPRSPLGRMVRLKGAGTEMLLRFPTNAALRVEDFPAWSAPPLGTLRDHADGVGARSTATAANVAAEVTHPILTGTAELLSGRALYLTVTRVDGETAGEDRDLESAFANRVAAIQQTAAKLSLNTPDPYLNLFGSALAVAADALWDAKEQCVMHGAVAWRVPLAGWRGPYQLDILGDHERARLHFRHWILRQNTAPVEEADPATGPWDPNVHLTRKEGMLHSNGDLSHNHYDMNMVFMDVLFRHLMWTGDLEFAREVWPAIERHLAWEHRLFRRTFRSESGEELPLYEAYAAIWASDNLQYNGGGAAHSSAYNVFAFRAAAKIASALGVDGSEYEKEASLIERGMNELLWIKQQGCFGESKDLLGPQTVYSNPALWTVYHTIDSEAATKLQAWQMVAERLAALKKIPIHGEGVPENGPYMLACSDWMPYLWSLNLLLLAENAHMALALWQAGMNDDAYRMLRGALLDSMYMGLCPGDFHMTSALDVHRQEAQRDFGDPIGIASRAVVEGLFGVQPNLLADELRVRPGFPTDWTKASLHHREFDFTWIREGTRETYVVESRFPRPVSLLVELPARTTSVPQARLNGLPVKCAFMEGTVGGPKVLLRLMPAQTWELVLEWDGPRPPAPPAHRSYAPGEPVDLPRDVRINGIEDPQGALLNGRASLPGFHTVFVRMRSAENSWLLPVSFTTAGSAPEFLPVPHADLDMEQEQVDLVSVLRHNIDEIFTRGYREPRSQYCSLAIPDGLLGGWANPDGRATIDGSVLRSERGNLKTDINVNFATVKRGQPNCLFLSHWNQDESGVRIPLTGTAVGVYLLLAGTTMPQCTRMDHGEISVHYADGNSSRLSLRNPDNWWPIEQDYLLDDYMFVNRSAPPPRVDLRTGETRLLDSTEIRGRGRSVPGGSANILHLPLNPLKQLSTLTIEVQLYGIVLGLLGVTLVRKRTRDVG